MSEMRRGFVVGYRAWSACLSQDGVKLDNWNTDKPTVARCNQAEAKDGCDWQYHGVRQRSEDIPHACYTAREVTEWAPDMSSVTVRMECAEGHSAAVTVTLDGQRKYQIEQAIKDARNRVATAHRNRQRAMSTALRKKLRTPVPNPDHTCGLYAWHDMARMGEYANGSTYGDVTIEGAVLGWGRVVLHDHGWRARYGQPLAFAPTKAGETWLLRELSARYGVPIIARDYLEAYAREHGERAPLDDDRSGVLARVQG